MAARMRTESAPVLRSMTMSAPAASAALTLANSPLAQPVSEELPRFALILQESAAPTPHWTQVGVCGVGADDKPAGGDAGADGFRGELFLGGDGAHGFRDLAGAGDGVLRVGGHVSCFQFGCDARYRVHAGGVTDKDTYYNP